MKNEQRITMSRYYIYKHDGSQQDGCIQYRRVVKNDWVDNLDQATLCWDFETTLQRAQSLQNMYPKDFVCIGKVHVMVDPYYVGPAQGR